MPAVNSVPLKFSAEPMHEPLPLLFGRQIRRRREAADMSQEELGAKTELSRNYIGMIERGETNPTLLVLNDLAAALGTSMSAIIGDLEADIAASEASDG